MKRKNKMFPRSKLAKHVQELSNHQLLYIQAPAGFGKTVFAELWTEKYPFSATITLDEYDNQMDDFCQKAKNALLALQPNHTALHRFLRDAAFANAPEEYILRALLLIPTGVQASLVIDDLHFVNNPAVLNTIRTILRRIPSGMQGMVLSRTQPPEIFSEFYLKEKMVTITSDWLVFNQQEIRMLYKINNKSIDAQTASEIYSLTEGWPLGINALLLSREAVPEQRMLPVHLEDFLKTQIWDTWEEPLQDFMLKTAVVSELTPDICAALTGRENCANILENLSRGNIFLWKERSGAYRFHRLFREFLLAQFSAKSQAFQNKQYQLAGEYFYARREYYKSVDYFLKSRDEKGIVRCVSELVDPSNAALFHIDQMLGIIRQIKHTQIPDKNKFMYGMLAWDAYLAGNPDDMEYYVDKYYRNLPQIILRYPKMAHMVFFVLCIDYRISLQHLSKKALHLPGIKINTQSSAGTITQSMPFFHRSSRDFSEYALGDIEADIGKLYKAIGLYFGEERDLFTHCILSGLFYERGDLAKSHKYALTAVSDIRESFQPEARFCAMSMLVHVLRALWQYDRADLMMQDIDTLIESKHAYSLSYNVDAYKTRCALENGMVEAATVWLEEHDADPFGPVTFYHLYGHFTTSRAYIALGHFDKAIVTLQKMLNLLEKYHRPLDEIEAHILIAAALWKRKRGHQKEAMAHMECAVRKAQPYGYVQAFANEGAEIASMLNRLQNRLNRTDYAGDIEGTFVKKLHILCVGQADHTKGLTGGRLEEALRFTRQQKKVMALLCEGNSYKKIGEHMGIKFSTVRSHIELIYKKLDVTNEMEAILKIKSMHLLEGFDDEQ